MDLIKKLHFQGGRHGTADIAQIKADPPLWGGHYGPKNMKPQLFQGKCVPGTVKGSNLFFKESNTV